MIDIKSKAVSVLSEVLSNYKVVSKKNINSMNEVNSIIDFSPTLQNMWPSLKKLRENISLYLQDKSTIDAKGYIYENGLRYLVSRSLHKINGDNYYIIEHNILSFDYNSLPIVSITTQTKFKSFPTDKIFSSLNKAISNLYLCTYEVDTNIYLTDKRILHSIEVKNIEDINFSTNEINTIEYFDYLRDLNKTIIKLVFYNNDPIYYKYYNDIIEPYDYSSLIYLKKLTEIAEKQIDSYIKYKFEEDIIKYINNDDNKIFLLNKN